MKTMPSAAKLCFYTYFVFHHHHHQVTSGGAPFKKHSRLRWLTPFWTVLCTLERWVEAQVEWLEVEFNGTEPGPPRSTSWMLPVRRETIDGCTEGSRMILNRVNSSYMAEQTATPWRNERGSWILIGPAPDLLVGDMSRVWNTQYRHTA